MERLSAHFRIRRRYMRSVNLERDAELSDSLDGYVLTPRAIETFDRVLHAFLTPNVTRAWTLTGVYGTGKSAFANFLAALFATKTASVRGAAERVLAANSAGASLAKQVRTAVPDEGLVRAIVTARREPLAHTIVRALERGAEDFWSRRRGRKPKAVDRVLEFGERLRSGRGVSANEIPGLVRDLADASGTGLLIVIDELGKLLEYAGRTGGSEDVFLLQQLAELPAGPKQAPVLLLGMLHQAFSEYGHMLSSAERAEWEKVQGRFEDVPFAESPDQLIRLMAEAIDADLSKKAGKRLERHATAWHGELAEATGQDYVVDLLPAERIRQVYPIHPVVALALPALCTRYGQHDRSLFTFMASSEAHALGRFLQEQKLDLERPPLLQLPTVYDYFIDSARMGAAGRFQLHRWGEVQGAIREATGLDSRAVAALKVIGTLNLVGSSGPVRARRALVLSALLTAPCDEEERREWQAVLDELVERRVVTYRQQVDEYRIWQGTDFDVDVAIERRIEGERRSLSSLLEEAAPLSPVVAQRHSYETGTLRFFERHYVDDEARLAELATDSSGSAGAIAYWVGPSLPANIPSVLANGKPVVVTVITPTALLVSATHELLALQQIRRKEPALLNDGVARKEVSQRLDQAREVLENVLRTSFEQGTRGTSWFAGSKRMPANYNAALSDLCDTAYAKGPVLWNEIINRRNLTSQGARAQRELIAALLTHHHEACLGIEGTGPEFSIYSSLLQNTGVHKFDAGTWVLAPPTDSGIQGVWQAIERFCVDSTEKPRPLSELLQLLREPPYGATTGIIPVLLAAVLIYHSDDVTLYQDGTFSPTLTPPQFELLVKHPDRFSVKYFELTGIRWELFKEIESVLKASGARQPAGARNATLLTVVRPLVQFAVSLPTVTRKAKDLSAEARGVLDALLGSRDPDRLIFETLPEAVGQQPFRPGETDGGTRHDEYRSALFACLRELQQYYDRVLERCHGQIHEAFGVRTSPDHLREDLRVRASYMTGRVIERRMKSFVLVAADETRSDREWLESLVMVIADRPADSWTPENKLSFELSLGDFARRFANLEALQRDGAREGLEGFEAKRITITEASGEEVHRLIWVSQQDRGIIQRRAEQLLDGLQDIGDEHQRQAVLMTIIERALETQRPAEVTAAIAAAHRGGRKRKHG